MEPIHVTSQRTDFLLTNNGHSAKISPTHQEINHKPVGDFKGGILGDDHFCLFDIHFHWGNDLNGTGLGSEHLRNGKQFPMEAHFVFYDCSYKSILHALNDSLLDEYDRLDDAGYKLAVIGVFFEIGHENEYLQVILDELEYVSTPSTYEETINFDFGELLNNEESEDGKTSSVNIFNYFSYYGSLTTPGCFPVVRWHVVKEPLTMSQEQFDTLFETIHNCEGEHVGGNNRELQDNVNELYSFCGLTEEETEEDLTYTCTEVYEISTDGEHGDDTHGGGHADVKKRNKDTRAIIITLAVVFALFVLAVAFRLFWRISQS